MVLSDQESEDLSVCFGSKHVLGLSSTTVTVQNILQNLDGSQFPQFGENAIVFA